MQESIFHQIHRLNYLTSELDGMYHQASVQIGLAASAMRILYAIYDNGDGCLLNTICRQAGISKQTVNSAIRKLEKAEILYMVHFRGKSKKVMLTEKGKAYLGQTAARIYEAESRAFAAWTEADVEEYLRLTGKFAESFREQVQAMHSEVTK